MQLRDVAQASGGVLVERWPSTPGPVYGFVTITEDCITLKKQEQIYYLALATLGSNWTSSGPIFSPRPCLESWWS